ncbi:MAG TPA: tetratricopeptide repeat protein [Tepidisphaeraceae bacterium]|jgi:tetratricopeptide (TPR) repeat protein
MNAAYQRALILFEQRRYDDAERELKQVLSGDPHDAQAHAMLGLCLAQRKEYAGASAEADAAVGLEPALPFAHYVRALVLTERNRFEEAATAVHGALRLDPFSPDFYALQARIRLAQRRWPSALESAEHGLSIQADHAACANLRAMALVQLGRREEAGAALDDSLARDPHNAYTHANQGWAYLHKGDHRKALEHFREALRLDPELDFARAGMVEALKARHLIYRIMLRYFLWMGRLGRQAQWGIIIGFYVGYRVVLQAAQSKPQLAPFLYPLVGLYVLFAYFTWTSGPFFNLLLRVNRFGRYVLSRDQRIASNWVGGALLLAVVCGVIWFTTRDPAAAFAAIYCLVMVIALAGTMRAPRGWPRWAMIASTFVVAALGAGAVTATHFALTLQSQTLLDHSQTLATAFVIGVFLQSIVANMLMSMTVKK